MCALISSGQWREQRQQPSDCSSRKQSVLIRPRGEGGWPFLLLLGGEGVSQSPGKTWIEHSSPTTLVEAMSKDLCQIATSFLLGSPTNSWVSQPVSAKQVTILPCDGTTTLFWWYPPQIPSTTVLVPSRAIHLFPAWGCGCPKVNNPAWATGN